MASPALPALSSSDWYFILTAVAKLAPFGPLMKEQKERVLAIVTAIYHETPRG